MTTTQQLTELTELANRAGAEGIWLIRGAVHASLTYLDRADVEKLELALGKPIPGEVLDVGLIEITLADAGLIVVMRFPVGDGGEAGVQSL